MPAQNADVVSRLERMCAGGHYSWPTLYEAVMGERFSYECSPTESEAKFAERLISLISGEFDGTQLPGASSVLVDVALPLSCVGTVRCDFDGDYHVEVMGYETDTDKDSYWRVSEARAQVLARDRAHA